MKQEGEWKRENVIIKIMTTSPFSLFLLGRGADLVMIIFFGALTLIKVRHRTYPLQVLRGVIKHPER